jgi:hypothetical protein
MKRLSAREQTLVVVGVFVLLGGFEILFRLLPAKRELAQQEEKIARLESALAPRPRPSVDPELGKWISQRAEKRARLESERALLARLERSFAKDEPATLAAISELAERAGVLVRESAPERGADDLTRPRRHFTVIATFASLRELVLGLASLPQGPVHLDRFELEAVALPPAEGEADDASDPHVLVATFVVVL